MNNLFWQIIQNREKATTEKWSGNIFCDGKISLSALHTPSNFLLLSHGSLNAAEVLAKYGTKQKWNLNGVSGPKDLVNHFIQCNGTRGQNMKASSKRVFKIFQTNINIKTSFSDDYQLSHVRSIDWPKVRIWAQQFALEADYTMDLTSVVQMARQMNTAKKLFILTDYQNHPCAMAGFGRSTDRYQVINMVYVPKSLRGQGIGEALVVHMSNHAKEQGYEQCLLFSEWTGSRNLYEAMGCKKIGTFMEYDLF